MRGALWLSYACCVAASMTYVVGLDPVSGGVGGVVAVVFLGLIGMALDAFREGEK